MDEEGFLYIMSRSDDVINVAGHRLSAGALEEVSPMVAAAAVMMNSSSAHNKATLSMSLLLFEVSLYEAVTFGNFISIMVL